MFNISLFLNFLPVFCLPMLSHITIIPQRNFHVWFPIIFSIVIFQITTQFWAITHVFNCSLQEICVLAHSLTGFGAVWITRLSTTYSQQCPGITWEKWCQWSRSFVPKTSFLTWFYFYCFFKLKFFHQVDDYFIGFWLTIDQLRKVAEIAADALKSSKYNRTQITTGKERTE